MDDKTHGDGADRAGRTERCIVTGKNDDSECVGNKNAGATASLMGGSNAKGEGIPAFVSLACTNFDIDILTLGPVATVNGIMLGTQGVCNPKGSIDGAGAIAFVNDSLVPMFDAHGAPQLPSPPMPPLSPRGCA